MVSSFLAMSDVPLFGYFLFYFASLLSPVCLVLIPLYVITGSLILSTSLYFSSRVLYL